MCLTFGNPSEPCCNDQFRCAACPGTDWSQYTWKATLSSGAPQISATEFFAFNVAQQLGNPAFVSAQYEPRSFLLWNVAPCVWAGGPLIALRASVGPANAGENLVGFADSLALQKTADGWRITLNALYAEEQPEIRPPNAATSWTVESPVYLQQSRFNCEGRNTFFLNQDTAGNSLFFPQFITVERVPGRGFENRRSFVNF